MEKTILAVAAGLSGIVSIYGVNSINSQSISVRDYLVSNGRTLIQHPIWGEMDNDDLKKIISSNIDSSWLTFTENSDEDQKIKQLKDKCEELFKKRKTEEKWEEKWEENIKKAEQYCSTED